MSQSEAPGMSGIPGIGAMADTLEFVKNMWGGMKAPGMSLPGVAMPTLSVEEINKQIADLKAVESWLTLNMNMLRGTIQALEVQSATLSALHAMGQTMSAMVRPDGGGASAGNGAGSRPSPASSFTAATTRTAGGFDPSVPGAADNRTSTPLHAASPDPAPFSGGSPFTFEPPTAEKPRAPHDESEPQAASPATAKDRPAASATAVAPDMAAGLSAPFANPAAWWNMLQDQFKQAVGSAVAPDASYGKDKGKGSAGTKAAHDAGTKTEKSAAKSVLKSAGGTASKSAPRPAAKPVKKPARKSASKTPVQSGANGKRALRKTAPRS